jgi:acyl-coenzyme A thioesterase PaaI-like protein
MDQPLQDVLQVHCYGCGALNAHGLHIKSRWDRDDLLCNWQPEAYQIGHPGYVYGGTIASVVDCHCIWTALAQYCRDTAHSLTEGPPAVAFVTGSLKVDYLRPIPIEGEMMLRAHVIEASERKSIVACSVFHSGIERVTVQVVAVRTKLGG